MDAHAAHHDHHEMPTEGAALTGVAVSATLHCLTGCAIGEVAGVAIGTAAGFSDAATIALAIALAFLFGYALTSLPLLRTGMALAAVIPIALASDTLSIATMEVVDNVILLVIPGAMDAGLADILFWGSLSFALFVAFVLTVPGQPLAYRPRQGALRRTRDRRPRRAGHEAGGRSGCFHGCVRHRRADRRGVLGRSGRSRRGGGYLPPRPQRPRDAAGTRRDRGRRQWIPTTAARAGSSSPGR